MAYVVKTKGRRYEIRESTVTPAGPRSRTLTTFTELDEDVLAAARSRATGMIDGRVLRRASRRLGAPVADAPADGATRRLIGELAAGRRPSPGLEALLRQILDPGAQETSDDLALWVDADDERRGQALIDLLGLADRFPVRRHGPLAMPRLTPLRS